MKKTPEQGPPGKLCKERSFNPFVVFGSLVLMLAASLGLALLVFFHLFCRAHLMPFSFLLPDPAADRGYFWLLVILLTGATVWTVYIWFTGIFAERRTRPPARQMDKG